MSCWTEVFNSKKMIRLNISTWVGTIGYAQHYYGRLHQYDNKDRIDVTYELTAEDVEKLNVDDGWTWRVGDISTRFCSREQLIEEAKKAWKKEYPDGSFLAIGDTAIIEPMEIIGCDDEEVMTHANQIWEQFEELTNQQGMWGFDKGSPEQEELERLEQEWEDYMREYINAC